MVEKHAAKPLHGGADRLPMDNAGIDRVTNILHRKIIDDFDVPAARIDRHVSGMCAVAIGTFRIGEGAFYREEFSGYCGRLADLGKPDRTAVLRHDMALFKDHVVDRT